MAIASSYPRQYLPNWRTSFPADISIRQEVKQARSLAII